MNIPPIDAEMTLRTLHKRSFVNSVVHVKDGQEALDWLFGKGAYAGRDPSHPPKVVLWPTWAITGCS